MKKEKRFLAIGLALVMSLSLAACGSEKTPASDTDKPADVVADIPADDPQEEESAYTLLTDADGNVYDLGGMEIIVGDWWTEDVETEATNDFEEARDAYIDWIQETYNFKIKTAAISTWGDMPQDFVNFATTGGDENYVFTLRQGSELASAMQSGLMYDLSTLDCLDLSMDKWKASRICELMSDGSAVYGMRGIAVEPRGGMYFNKRILTEAGIDPESLYTLQESGEWTWDKFEELCAMISADTDSDGKIDRFALSGANNSFNNEAIFSNGGEIIGKDESGKYINKLESDNTMGALTWAREVLKKYEMTYPEDAAWDYFASAFTNGEYAFRPDQAYVAGQLGEMVDDFGFVCFPKGPMATDYVNCYEDNVYVIPACYDHDRAWNIAFAYDLYTNPIPGFEGYADWKTNYYKSFRDTESVDLTIARLMTNGTITYSSFITGLDMGPEFWWAINDDNTPAQQAETIRNTWQSYLDTANGLN